MADDRIQSDGDGMIENELNFDLTWSLSRSDGSAISSPELCRPSSKGVENVRSAAMCISTQTGGFIQIENNLSNPGID
jgi:hypothetical protein